MQRIKKYGENNTYSNHCSFCNKDINLSVVDMFEIAVPGIVQNICEDCLKIIATEIKDALKVIKK